jgi:enoyl-CoA hydratase/carnithine racemase
MEYENILYEATERIARVTLNRPNKRNALSTGLSRNTPTRWSARSAIPKSGS